MNRQPDSIKKQLLDIARNMRTAKGLENYIIQEGLLCNLIQSLPDSQIDVDAVAKHVVEALVKRDREITRPMNLEFRILDEGDTITVKQILLKHFTDRKPVGIDKLAMAIAVAGYNKDDSLISSEIKQLLTDAGIK